MSDASKDTQSAFADAAAVSNTLWLSYLFAVFYLLVAAAGVTHLDIFLENPVKLPFLSVDLPLKGFFWMGPLILLVVHAYVLLHFALLAEKASLLTKGVSSGAANATASSPIALPIDIFVQMLTRPRASRPKLIGFLILMIAWISLVFAPVLLLVFFELQFLPYQSLWITYWHRVALVLDLVLVWRLWPGVPDLTLAPNATRYRRWATPAMMIVVTVASLCLVWFVATLPGELKTTEDWWPHRLLVAGAVDPNTQRPTSLWSNRLVLPALDLVDHAKLDTQAKLAAAPVLQSLRGRKLVGAVLSYAQLPNTDFTAADLREASLDGLNAPGSWFDYADLSGARLDGAALQGASFYASVMQGASLDSVQLQGAHMVAAQLQGAWMASANLEGVSLISADLRRSILDKADLRGSTLAETRLQGASIADAKLWGASMDHAFIWKAVFSGKDLLGLPKTRIVGLDSTTANPSCERLPQQSCEDQPDLLIQIIARYTNRHTVEAANRIKLKQDMTFDDKVTRWRQPVEANLTAPDPPNWKPFPFPESDGEDEQGLEKFWLELACTGNGAPFILMSLIDALKDESSETVPHSPMERERLLNSLLDKDCTAEPVISPATRMQLKDLRPSHSRG